MARSDGKPLLVLLDGHAMVYRAFYAIQNPMTVSATGEEVRGVYGFLNTFLRNLSDLDPTHCAIAFDLSGPTFRHAQYDEYKATRPPMPPELRQQVERVREIMHAFKIPVLEREGYEADDVLGTLCRKAEEQGVDTVVLTGDTDELQLVSDRVRVLLSYSVQRTTMYDVEKVKERYDGLGPGVVADIKALQGDTTDNIPGVPGVGAKTAIKLLTQFGSVEGIIERLDEVKPPRTQQSIRDHVKELQRGKFLTTIVRDLDLDLDMDGMRLWNYDRAEVLEKLKELEFFSIVSRIPEPQGDGAPTQGQLIPEPEERETRYTVVDTQEGLREMADALDSPGGFAFEVVSTAMNPMYGDLVGIAFSNEANAAWYVPVGHTEGEQASLEAALDAVRGVLESESIPKSAHDANFGMTVLARHGVTVRNVGFDPMIAAHVGGRKAVGIEALALESLDIELKPVTDITGTGRKQITMTQASIGDASGHACVRADATWQLRDSLTEETVEKGVAGALDEFEMPLIPVLVRMQRTGVAVDVDHLRAMSGRFERDIERTEAGMFELVGHEFNIGSSQQLGGVLFDELRLPPTKKRKTGYATDAQSLEWLRQEINRGVVEDVNPVAVEVLDRVLEYRQLTKIKSTYLDSLPGQVNPATGRVHTMYHQTGSATGRVSSNDPNVQNIPIRTEMGREVRQAFVAQDPEWTLLGADYSQIELRILAHLSRDAGLIDAFESGMDIHAATASSVYGVGIDEVDSEMRRIAKIMNFGVIYGLSPFGMSQQTGLSPEEGKTFIDAYFGKYPGIESYIDGIKRSVKDNGYVETLKGRRRYIPEIRSPNFHQRSAGERMAINMPIQGTAADILKLAMVRLQAEMDTRELRSMMILQVHDELIFEAPQDEMDEMKGLVGDIMPAAMTLAVPLEVDVKTGANWGDME